MAAEGVGETSSYSAKDGSQEDLFEIGQDSKSENPFSYDEDAPNLVTEFKGHPEGMAALKRISTMCRENFDQAWKSTDGFRKKHADIWNLFAGTLDEKKPEFRGMANAHLPMMMENIIRMTYRQSYELFGNWTNVFGVTPVGPDDEKTANLLSLHGNWQIRKKIPDFKMEIGRRGLLIFNLFGDLTVHSYWDTQRRGNRHEVLTASEFCCSNSHVSTMPDYSDVSWMVKILFMDAHELRKMGGAWEYLDETLRSIPPPWDDPEIDQEVREAVDKSLGVDSTEFLKGQYRLLQYEGWLNLPPSTAKNANGEDSKPRDRYCKAVIDSVSGCILQMNIHERTDPYDKRRYEFQMQQYQQWQQSQQEMQKFQQAKQQASQSAMEMALSQDPSAGPDLPSQGILMARAVEESPAPQEMPMPDWMNGDPSAMPEKPATIPIRMFTHFVNIPPVQGVIGLGTGSMLAPQNKAANILLSMVIDQGTLANFGQFLAKSELRLPEKFIMGPGKIHKVQGSTDLSKDIVPFNFPPANPQLFQLIEILQQSAQSMSNTPEVLSGEPGKSGETAQGVANRVEQATKMLSVPTGSYADGVTQVLINNAALNALFLDDVEFFSVNNHDPSLGQLGRQGLKVGREMYDRPYDVEFSADLKFSSTSQRISEADALVQLPNAVQTLAGNFAFQYATIRKSLEARNRYDLIALLGAPPQPPAEFGAPTSPPAPPPGMVPPTSPAPGAGAPKQGDQQGQKPQQPQPAKPPAPPPSQQAPAQPQGPQQ